MSKETRKLASIQQIAEILPIEGKDQIGLATFTSSAWKSIVRFEEAKPGDLIVFMEPDSVLPEIPLYEFMRKKKFRVSRMKMGGVISEGLCIPIKEYSKKELPDKFLEINKDVTDKLRIEYYDRADKEVSTKKNSGLIKFLMKFYITRSIINFVKKLLREDDNFPSYIVSKTDEPRVQNCNCIVDKNKGKIVSITEKIDGKSATYVSTETEFMVCSRNYKLKKDITNEYWKIALKLNLHELMKEMKKDLKTRDKFKTLTSLVIQGELAGPGIQGNKLKLKEQQLFIFNVIITTKDDRYKLTNYHIGNLLSNYPTLQTVPNLPDEALNYTVDELVNKASGKSLINKDVIREGIVIRIDDPEDTDRVGESFKVLNIDYLLKFES